jgi:hypothetical protein
MGLDWNPLGKPRTGLERQFYDLLGRVTVENWLQPSPVQQVPLPEGIDRAAGREYQNRLWKELTEITISPYETLGAPRVGRDAAGDAWIRNKYENAPNKSASIDEWVQKFQGFYVIELVPVHDGLPIYSNWPLDSHWERWSFRAQFLRECEDVLDPSLLDEAWLHHTASQLADYGVRLMGWATAYAEKEGVTRIVRQRELETADVSDEIKPIQKAHFVASAARWAAWWSERGHGMMADF